jgi:hypothetical protein
MTMQGIDHHESVRRRPSLARGAVRRTVALGLVLAGAGAAALPSTGLAATNTTKTVNYTVAVKKGVLARGSTVKAKAVVVAPQNNVSDWWSQAAVSSVVRSAVNSAYQKPYIAEGYRCTPVVRSKTTSFTCILRGADVPTSITLKFAVNYRG